MRAKDARGYSVFFRKDKRRWVLSYASADGGMVQKTCDESIPAARKAQAERWAQGWMREKGITPGKVLAERRDSGRKIRDLVPLWEELRLGTVKIGGLAMATHVCAMGLFKNHILDAEVDGVRLGDVPINELEPRHGRKWMRAFAAGHGISTVRNGYFAFSAFVDAAIAEDWTHVRVNPLKDPGVKAVVPVLTDDHRTKSRAPIASVASMQKLLTCEAIPLQRRVRYALVATAGSRDGELAGLLWEDVDLDGAEPMLRITKALSLVGPEGHATMGATKNRRHRAVPLHPAAVAALADWKAWGWTETVGREPRPGDAVFVAASGPRKGMAVRPDSAALFRADLALAGCPEAKETRIRFHSIRGSFVSWMTRAGVHETVIQQFVGQGGKGVTQRHYVHAEWEQMVEALGMLSLSWTAALPPGHNPPALPASSRAPLESSTQLESAGDERQNETRAGRSRLDALWRSGFVNSRSRVQISKSAPVDPVEKNQGDARLSPPPSRLTPATTPGIVPELTPSAPEDSRAILARAFAAVSKKTARDGRRQERAARKALARTALALAQLKSEQHAWDVAVERQLELPRGASGAAWVAEVLAQYGGEAAS